ncbi:MAG: DUF4921 family protein [Patescibacteria group bacterium]|nr:DUF4921 family protein [Patescibacteria group bacterium]
MSELRKDPISGDWIILAVLRAKRPQQLEYQKPVRKPAPKSGCPFEDLKKSGNTPIAVFPSGKNWRIAVIPNKYPALDRMALDARSAPKPSYHGVYEEKTGVGDHELIITRDHSRFFADLAPAEAVKVFELFQERYRSAAKDGRVSYAFGFLNYGPAVGASIWHPHYQFLAIPFIPPHVAHSLQGARSYLKRTGHCARCDIIKQERAEKKRIIAENENAVAFAPFVSKRPFEASILPKKHFAQFERTPQAVIRDIAALAQTVLRRMRKYAGDPDLNFFIHSAPFSGRHSFHHWHMEIFPHTTYLGGFEFGTSVYINPVDPDRAAAVLRGE